jgi:C1A family cysteine protease
MKTLLVLAFIFSGVATNAAIINVNNVQSEIAHKQAGWKAKDTWLNGLTKDEITRMMGLQEIPKGHLDFISTGTHSPNPTSLDWRNQEGINWLGSVMNQGNCGSCVAFATVATLEARMSIAYGSPWLRPTLSPAQLFSCGGGSCSQGWMPESASSFLKTRGIVDEACMPYTSGSTGVDQSCQQTCANAPSRTTKITAYNRPSTWGGSVDAVKAALKTGPLETTLTVYADFIVYSGGIYKHVAGPRLGGHAVSLVGYDDAKQAWLIRNSWGPEWGENGFGWISWSDTSGVGSNTWSFQVTPQNGVLAVGAPADRELVSGRNYQLQALGAVNDISAVRFHLLSNSGQELLALDCKSRTEAGCAGQLDTTTLPEGKYGIYITGTTGFKSLVREFFVINSEPQMALSFTAAAGTNLSMPLNGRPEFDITAKFSPIPIQHIEFQAIDSNGKVAAVKSNDYVLDKMRMGWRTMTVPDGTYTILFRGQTKVNGKVYNVESNKYSVTVKN